jgi:hypothetical protein
MPHFSQVYIAIVVVLDRFIGSKVSSPGQARPAARPGERRRVENVLVDTGAELSWVPAPILESLGIERHDRWRFRQADKDAGPQTR